MRKKYLSVGDGDNSTGQRVARWGKRLALTLLALLAVSGAHSQSMEFGVQYDYRGPAAFVYMTTDFNLGYWGSVGIWFSPSLEVSFGQSFVDGFFQAQFLVDAPWATLSVRAKGELLDNRQRGEIRIGVLIGR